MRFGSAITWVANSIPVTAITNLASTVKAYVLSDFAAPTAPLNLNSQKITNLAAGTAAADAVNKGQLDAAASGFAKVARGTFTGNSSATTFDAVHNLGTAVVAIQVFDSAGNRVLVDTPPKSGATTTTAVVTFATAPTAAEGAFSWVGVG